MGHQEGADHSATQREVENYTATRQQVEKAASQAAIPTPAQAESGNYRLGHLRIHGLDISIENAKGSIRKAGWKPLAAHYGYIKRTLGRDSDHVDCFLGDHPESEIVFVIDQVTEAGRFDEHKTVIGETSEKAAKDLYLANYPEGWKCGPITPMTIGQFKAWLADGDTTKPVAKQVSKYAQEWRTLGGGAPAMIDTESGEILAGCPGLEGEDIDEIGEDETPESRQRREQKQEKAEDEGWESEEDKDARAAWEDAKKNAPDGTIVLLKLGDTYHAFGEDAQKLRGELQMGDGDKAEFDADLLDKHLGELVANGHRVAIAERTEGRRRRPGRPSPRQPCSRQGEQPRPGRIQRRTAVVLVPQR